MEFYNNERNDKLNFKINIEGIDITKIEPRLIITNEKTNYLFFGKIKDNICTFDVPELTNYSKGDEGKVKFEIISEDLYFPVWSDEFEIKTKASVKIEELYHEIQQPTKPKVSVGAVLEKTKAEKVKEEKPKKVEEKVVITEKDKVEKNMEIILENEKKKEKELVEELKKLEEDNDDEVKETKETKVEHKNESVKNKEKSAPIKHYQPIETMTDKKEVKTIKKFNDL